jgi:hypothetical protein
MQVDTEPFPINIIEPANKKVLVQPKVVDKGKGKASSLVILSRRIYRKEGMIEKLQTVTSLEVPGACLIEQSGKGP